MYKCGKHWGPHAYLQSYLGSGCGGQTPESVVSAIHRLWCETLLVFTPLCRSLPLSADRTCDLLLTNRIWQMSGDVTSVMIYTTLSQATGVGEMLLCWLWGSKPPCGETVYEGSHVQRKVGWPLASESCPQLTDGKKMGTSLLQPQGNGFCQHWGIWEAGLPTV